MVLPRTYLVCLLIVKHSFRRGRSRERCSLLATGKYSAPARSQGPHQEPAKAPGPRSGQVRFKQVEEPPLYLLYYPAEV